jgi:gliding motility-associated-like protein
MFPTVVTANGDGVNDIFEIHDLLNESFFTENELYIYSRYGKQVYHKKNIKTKEDFWNPQSTNSATGSYFYRFTAKGRTKKIDFNGSLEVIR